MKRLSKIRRQVVFIYDCAFGTHPPLSFAPCSCANSNGNRGPSALQPPMTGRYRLGPTHKMCALPYVWARVDNLQAGINPSSRTLG
jgi:hypothetical protein